MSNTVKARDIKAALIDAGYSDSEIRFSGNIRIGYVLYVLSQKFSEPNYEVNTLARQVHIWGILMDRFSEDDLEDITLIIAHTPREFQDIYKGKIEFTEV